MMAHGGLVKLGEECGELVQIAMKAVAFPGVEVHPDGKPVRPRLEEEIADVEAAIEMVKRNHGLDRNAIELRVRSKLRRFEAWHAEPEETRPVLPVPAMQAGKPAVPPDPVEVLAREIYEAYPDATGHPWIPHGNSSMQDQARREARNRIDLIAREKGWKP